jgi:hypothetical protein
MLRALNGVAPDPVSVAVREPTLDDVFLALPADVAWRNLRIQLRTPQALVFATIQPVIFVLLFRYAFGGAIHVPGTDYVDFLMPGIFAQTVALGAVGTCGPASWSASVPCHWPGSPRSAWWSRSATRSPGASRPSACGSATARRSGRLRCH